MDEVWFCVLAFVVCCCLLSSLSFLCCPYVASSRSLLPAGDERECGGAVTRRSAMTLHGASLDPRHHHTTPPGETFCFCSFFSFLRCGFHGSIAKTNYRRRWKVVAEGGVAAKHHAIKRCSRDSALPGGRRTVGRSYGRMATKVTGRMGVSRKSEKDTAFFVRSILAPCWCAARRPFFLFRLFVAAPSSVSPLRLIKDTYIYSDYRRGRF